MKLFFSPRSEFDRALRAGGSPQERTALFACLARINALYMIMRAGSGHIGSSFSSLDLVSWLLINEPGFAGEPGREHSKTVATARYFSRYFSSKGHDAPGLYAVLAGLGVLPFEHIHRLRRVGGLPGHPDVGTPGIVANTGSLGMGISKAKGMALAHRLRGERVSVYVMTGDGELQEGQIWESLQSAAEHRLGEITVVVDHNKLQSDTWIDQTSPLGDLEAKFRAFGWHVSRCNGHELAAIEAAFGDLRQYSDRPKVLIADTVKGRGVSFMEAGAMQAGDRLYRYHSGAPSKEQYERALGELSTSATAAFTAVGEAALELDEGPPGDSVPPSLGRPQRLVRAYSEALVELGRRHAELVVLDADLALDCGLHSFRDAFPDRLVECGIAEQDMVSQAGGMARDGALPVVHSFACFLSARPNEQIYNNATEKSRIVYVGSLAGLLPAGPGHSHQAIRDIASLKAIPGLVLIEPSCEDEVALALEYAVERAPGSTYLRLVSVPWPVDFSLPASYRLEEGRGVELRPGSDALIIGYGPILLSQALAAAERLAREFGIDLAVVNLPWLNLVDDPWLLDLVTPYRHLFTLDNHHVEGGQGETLFCRLAELGALPSRRCRRLGVRGIPVCGRSDEVLRHHRLDADSLAADIRDLVRQRK